MKEEALKLADELASTFQITDYGLHQSDHVKKASKMIRKLVAELEAKEDDIATLSQEHTSMRARNERLQAQNDALNLELGNPIDYEEWGKHQVAVELDKQGEPVAWTDDLWTIHLNDEYCMLDEDMKKDMIPLYTAPKELSDEEITAILIEQGIAQRLKRSGSLCFWQEDADLYEFARAILKKASEK